MAAVAGRALLRSLATRVARAPPLHHRLLPARRLHHSGPGRSSPPTGNEELTQNMKIPTEFDCMKAQFIRNTAIVGSILVSSGSLFYGCVMKKRNDALLREREKIKDDIIQGIKEEFKRIHIEAQ